MKDENEPSRARNAPGKKYANRRAFAAAALRARELRDLGLGVKGVHQMLLEEGAIPSTLKLQAFRGLLRKFETGDIKVPDVSPPSAPSETAEKPVKVDVGKRPRSRTAEEKRRFMLGK